VFQRLQYILVCTALLLSACRVRQVSVAPDIHPFESMAGFASLRISSGQQSARSRFSFVFRLPGKGRIEVFDPLGRVHYQILIVNRLSYFVHPSKKVFWRGGDTEILEKFLGFPLQLNEVAALMSGLWPDDDPDESTTWQQSWNLERDKRGRIRNGSRGEFQFQVEGYFEPSPWVQTVVFFHAQTEGRVKILNIHFDQLAADEIFSTAPLNRFAEISWEEMEKLLDAQN
jgi:hypothetical protein